MATLWQRMGEIYGSKWAGQYGDVPNDSWCRILADVPPQRLANGLRALVDRTNDWPPTAIEFRRLCYGDTDAWERTPHQKFQRVGIEHKPTVSPEIPKAWKWYMGLISKDSRFQFFQDHAVVDDETADRYLLLVNREAHRLNMPDAIQDTHKLQEVWG